MQRVYPDQTLIGVGLYGPTEAARLTGATVGQIRRWLAGHQGDGKVHEPLWRRQIDGADGGLVIGFKDLMQVKVAKALLEKGLSAHKVRKAILAAQAMKGDSHPLARADFATDGATAFLQVLTEGNEPGLIDLLRSGQFVMRKIIAESLRGVEYDEEEPVRWRPFAGTPRIVLDPMRQFGAPLDDESGVPTRVLSAAFTAEGSIKGAARLYRVEDAAVRQSVAFESKLAA